MTLETKSSRWKEKAQKPRVSLVRLLSNLVWPKTLEPDSARDSVKRVPSRWNTQSERCLRSNFGLILGVLLLSGGPYDLQDDGEFCACHAEHTKAREASLRLIFLCVRRDYETEMIFLSKNRFLLRIFIFWPRRDASFERRGECLRHFRIAN